MKHKGQNLHVAVLIETDDSWGRNVVEAIARFAHASNWTLLIGPRDQQRRLRLPGRSEIIWMASRLSDSQSNRPRESYLCLAQVHCSFLQTGLSIERELAISSKSD